MQKIARTLLYSILVTIVWSAADARRAEAFPFTCVGLFREGHRSTPKALAHAADERSVTPKEADDYEEAIFGVGQKVLDLPDAEFNELAKPSETRFDKSVSQTVAEGRSLEDAVKTVLGDYNDKWKTRVNEYDKRGFVRTDLLPQVSLSLENGRQKLDFARIHFTKRDPEIAEEVLRDYLLLAEKRPDLKLLIVTNRDDLGEKLRGVSSSVRSRIEIQTTKTDLWIWAQDGSKPIDFPRETAEFGQPRYTKQTQELVQHGRLRSHNVNVKGWAGFFQGGNIVVGDRNVFVGAKEIEHVMLAYSESEASAVGILSSIYQKPVVTAAVRMSKHGGNEWSFHIDLDMVIAVNRHTNKEVVLVRSPEALLNALSGETLSTHPTDHEVLSIRDKIIARYRAGEFGKTLATGSREFVVRLAATSPFELRDMVLKGRLFRRLIKSYGYETRALPGFGDAQGAGQSLFFGTNAVLSEDLAIVPKNNMPELDRLVRAEYESLGYDVFMMRSAAKSICQQGGPRCVTETYRKPYLTRAP